MLLKCQELAKLPRLFNVPQTPTATPMAAPTAVPIAVLYSAPLRIRLGDASPVLALFCTQW